jgi:hypothetical protein
LHGTPERRGVACGIQGLEGNRAAVRGFAAWQGNGLPTREDGVRFEHISTLTACESVVSSGSINAD